MNQRSLSVDVDRSPDAMAAYQLAKTIHRSGGNPAGVFGLLAKVVEDRSWERLRNVEGKTFPSFTAFVETPEPYGLGTSRAELVKLVTLQHPREDSDPEWRERAPELRKAVRALLAEEIAPVRACGSNQYGGGSDTTSTVGHDRGSDYFTARLKRDDPEMAARVTSGEITANAAARAKGWSKPRIVLSSPTAVAISLRKHFTPDQLAELIAALLTEATEET